MYLYSTSSSLLFPPFFLQSFSRLENISSLRYLLVIVKRTIVVCQSNVSSLSSSSLLPSSLLCSPSSLLLFYPNHTPAPTQLLIPFFSPLLHRRRSTHPTISSLISSDRRGSYPLPLPYDPYAVYQASAYEMLATAVPPQPPMHSPTKSASRKPTNRRPKGNRLHLLIPQTPRQGLLPPHLIESDSYSSSSSSFFFSPSFLTSCPIIS